MTPLSEETKRVYKNIGNKLYILRLVNGYSMRQIGDVINTSGQQVQKYEKGTNRIEIYKLNILANFFKKSLSYFLEESEEELPEVYNTKHQNLSFQVHRNFMKVSNEKHQQAINELIKSLADDNAS